MMGYRFMARLRRYYTCIGGSLQGWRTAGRERQVASRHIWFSASEKTGEFSMRKAREGGLKRRKL